MERPLRVWLSFVGAGLWLLAGPQHGLGWFTDHVEEYSLAVDNIFVFVMGFASFAVPTALRHRGLFSGVIGALLMRGTMVVLGAGLASRFHWVIPVRGFPDVHGRADAVREGRGESGPGGARRGAPPVPGQPRPRRPDVLHGQERHTLRHAALPVFTEFAGLIFGRRRPGHLPPIHLSSFPAPATLGLHFLLAHVVDRFVYLRTGLSFVLAFIGAQLLTDVVTLPTTLSLSVGVVASLLATRERTGKPLGEG